MSKDASVIDNSHQMNEGSVSSLSLISRVMRKLNSSRFRYKTLALVILTTLLSITLLSSFFIFVVFPNQVETKVNQIQDDLRFLGKNFERELNLSKDHVFVFSESSFFRQLISLTTQNSAEYESSLNLTRQQSWI